MVEGRKIKKSKLERCRAKGGGNECEVCKKEPTRKRHGPGFIWKLRNKERCSRVMEHLKQK